MNNLDIIYAEAAVRSKRKDYLSIFNRQVELTQDNLRQFWGDPLVIKQAVEKLKTSGFGIVSVGKITVGIIGSPELFTQVFKVELIRTEAADGTVSYQVKTVKDGQSPYLIDASLSDFNTLLSGLALLPEAQPFVTSGGNTDPPIVELSQIPGLLNGWGGVLESMNFFGVNNWPASLSASVMVIDSGCDKTHAYFQNKSAISVANNPIMEPKVQRRLANLSIEKKSIFLQEDTLERIKKEEKRLRADEPDENAHGTSVVGHLVSTLQALSKVKIGVMKVDDMPWFPEVSNALQKPLVINCSHGPQDSLENYFSNLKDDIYLVKVLNAIIWGVIVVIAVGNANSGKAAPNEINTSTQIPGVIVVGGVYKDKDGMLVASDGTHGFPAGYREMMTKAVPHVCGISGPVSKTILNSPVAENGWKLKNGSSFAAPQIAGVCAIIKAHCPTATPLEVKEILIRTATPVTKGQTTQGIPLSDIKHQFGDEEFPTGLVNLKKALWTAVWYNMFKMLGPQYTIKDAVADAEKMMIAK